MEEKVSLPTKTKIAAYWINLLVGMGVSLAILGIIFFLAFPFISEKIEKISGKTEIIKEIKENFKKYYTPLNLTLFIFGGLLFLCFLCWSSFQLLRGKKWAWYFWVVFLFIICARDLIEKHRPSFAFIIPLILLLLDRKNFWKIAK